VAFWDYLHEDAYLVARDRIPLPGQLAAIDSCRAHGVSMDFPTNYRPSRFCASPHACTTFVLVTQSPKIMGGITLTIAVLLVMTTIAQTSLSPEYCEDMNLVLK
jgi:hypothetical protein